MHELISQLLRLYLPAGAAVPDGLEQHLAGETIRALDLASDGTVRTLVIPFDWRKDGGGTEQWERLCAVANALQGELGLPAPAVSISGAAGFRLWLSFESPLPVATAQHFLDLLRAAYFPELARPAQGWLAPVEMPPCRNPATGKWAAFIHPGMGASFADEPALEMMPPTAAQTAFLQGLQSIGAAQFQHALDVLQPALDVAQPPSGPAAAPALPAAAPPLGSDAVPPGLLLKDATLEDIVRFLHAKNIEPTFRHLLPLRL
ncbi:hypothetical protein [Pseudoduganella umbonata]|uniref:Uncharacterized protein n=1 Tax=Pseudoduganella umbonata TaxID=864828 RepID=A0A4P8HL45_9BURK|nr:hypothetical protein [Pseudoduganella umbonata]MBB3221164.1 hypothetical protein [Pseudoduganella umbonata]QCP10357.1 hypothetical protein FCL38_07870 [Pseudoduganella umbonata]